MAGISAEMRPVDEPLRFLLADSRQPKTRIEDGVWLRLVDVPAALKGRRYAVDGRLALRVRDPFCPWNDGQYELIGGPDGAECRSNGSTPDLALDAADLAALFLGGNRFRTLFEAGRVEELRPGAIARRSEEHTSELQSQSNLVCRLLLEKKKRDQLAAHEVDSVAAANGCVVVPEDIPRKPEPRAPPRRVIVILCVVVAAAAQARHTQVVR